MNSERVSLPLIHEHLMMPWTDLRRGDCCGRFEAISDGYYCESCDFFFHKKCCKSSEFVNHSSHTAHTLQLRSKRLNECSLCGILIKNICYHCEICDFYLDLYCAKYLPPEVVDVSETHPHKLTLLKEQISYDFDCGANCGKIGFGFSYKCHECDLAFHMDCVWHPSEVKHPSEVNHSHHSLHPLSLVTSQPPEYSDNKCRLCGRWIDGLFYHCSSCNFLLDMHCVLNPPPQCLMDLKTHHHQLTFLPRLLSFTCSACGLSGDRSPYICVQCDFMIHQDCLAFPRLININRHDHRISRTSLLGVVNSVCGVCRHKVDWTCGGYSCQKCPGYVVHTKCATSYDVWNGKELEGEPEEIEDTEPYVVIDVNTIHHFSHKEHYLRLNVNTLLWDENKRCNLCNHPICLHSFYNCMECDFILHQDCAECPKRKWHVLHNEQLTLVKSESYFWCMACRRGSNGFMYRHGNKKLDVRCGSVSEPFVHPSHLDHPLYYILKLPGEQEWCYGCHEMTSPVLECIEDSCRYVLCFMCVTLPQVVKHRVDDHPLSLCYGEKTCGKYWCDICEKETNPKSWFYTCKDHQASLHTECVLGQFSELMPGNTNFFGTSYEVVLNNSMSRPFCRSCKSHCMYPIIMKMPGTLDANFCSINCLPI